VPGAVDEPCAWLEDLVVAELRQPGRELARPALDSPELGSSGGAGVDGDAVTGQQA
jgi:hypothetical protein